MNNSVYGNEICIARLVRRLGLGSDSCQEILKELVSMVKEIELSRPSRSLFLFHDVGECGSVGLRRREIRRVWDCTDLLGSTSCFTHFLASFPPIPSQSHSSTSEVPHST